MRILSGASAFPRDARASITRLSTSLGLTFAQTAFLALLKLGVSQRNAYRLATASRATSDSCTVCGSRWASELGHLLDEIRIDEVLACLADWVPVVMIVAPFTTWKERLDAADQINRRLGRYDDPPSLTNTLSDTRAFSNSLRLRNSTRTELNRTKHREPEK